MWLRIFFTFLFCGVSLSGSLFWNELPSMDDYLKTLTLKMISISHPVSLNTFITPSRHLIAQLYCLHTFICLSQTPQLIKVPPSYIKWRTIKDWDDLRSMKKNLGQLWKQETEKKPNGVIYFALCVFSKWSSHERTWDLVRMTSWYLVSTVYASVCDIYI